MKTLDINAIENIRDACNNFIRSGYLITEGNMIMNSKDLRRNLMQNMAKRRLYSARSLLKEDKKIVYLGKPGVGKSRSVKTVGQH